ncbi:37S ribosomal protein S9, mitochondrial [Yamadazyma tenuis]|uniref:Ribosomal protein S5 domain 2-like protein n=1 Tax=Candida tenuis (strain ATCC 10573 / BCRC 21748 / CBS 615 / JCM 9827 / NBRC 10315 / NRRL Y-1498 / VKM Y-70) TaxID=590646 RepID=G3B2N9_CANTC|nr:ribosomal protein S5 domain 2-like protein [Yamadazyma tenuis ATCC 10573]EGV64725.1 ribosomal protein S5 domain 2-like protein [Yamadazyma tenuis ATCC 10573]WEJ97513.1 37S ribosomal protein S9, mitochondrial [Yamadazyma tenuis]
MSLPKSYLGLLGRTVRLFSSSTKVLNEAAPSIPRSIRNERLINVIPSSLGKDRIKDYEFERLRIVPELNTYYGGNPIHDSTMSRLQSLVQRHLHLPTKELTSQELSESKFLSFLEYRDNYARNERVKVAHHRDLIGLLNRLRSIDPQLMPKEVVETLNEFVSQTGQSTSKTRTIKTFDENGIAKAKGKKKTSVANIKLANGNGLIMVNGVNYTNYFTRDEDRDKITFPLLAIDKLAQFNVFAVINGGGISSKADALRLGLIKLLGQLNPIWKRRLKSANLRSVDPRIVERKKPGKVKARKSPTWVKR